ncbi:MAG: hypothetical protein JWM58_2791 [Rhizobium sp.]|nr:hypothetical protein [Rhizobium sp.]
MSKFVVLKLSDESGYWLVDFDNGSVTAMDTIVPDPFGYTAAANTSGAAYVSGVDVAVATLTRDDAFAGKYDT